MKVLEDLAMTPIKKEALKANLIPVKREKKNKQVKREPSSPIPAGPGALHGLDDAKLHSAPEGDGVVPGTPALGVVQAMSASEDESTLPGMPHTSRSPAVAAAVSADDAPNSAQETNSGVANVMNTQDIEDHPGSIDYGVGGLPVTPNKRQRFARKTTPSPGPSDPISSFGSNPVSLDIMGAVSQEPQPELVSPELYSPSIRQWAFARYGARAYDVLPEPKR